MATQRNQNQSQGQGKQNIRRGPGDAELEGVTEDGVEVSASLEDTGEEILEAYTGEEGEEGESAGKRGGSGNFANDRERASEAGRKGGRQ
jgi:hypothetical protein